MRIVVVSTAAEIVGSGSVGLSGDDHRVQAPSAQPAELRGSFDKQTASKRDHRRHDYRAKQHRGTFPAAGAMCPGNFEQWPAAQAKRNPVTALTVSSAQFPGCFGDRAPIGFALRQSV